MAQSYLRNPSVERLPVILEELRRGSLRIPPFQRDIEWEPEQRLALCHSVWMGLPIGALTVWRTSRRPECDIIAGLHVFANPRAPASRYLLDGRRRLTVLYSALTPNASDGTSWNIVFNLDSRDDDQNNFMFCEVCARLDMAPMMPLSVVLNDNAYDNWRSCHGLSREQTNRARALRSAFTDYLIPVVTLATDDVSVAALVYKRLNGRNSAKDDDVARLIAWGNGSSKQDCL